MPFALAGPLVLLARFTLRLLCLPPRVLSHGRVLKQTRDVGAKLAVSVLTLPVLLRKGAERALRRVTHLRIGLTQAVDGIDIFVRAEWTHVRQGLAACVPNLVVRIVQVRGNLL